MPRLQGFGTASLPGRSPRRQPPLDARTGSGAVSLEVSRSRSLPTAGSHLPELPREWVTTARSRSGSRASVRPRATTTGSARSAREVESAPSRRRRCRPRAQCSLRDLGRRRRDRRRGRQARLQPLRGLRPHGRRAERLQHQSRRHHLLGQRDRRLAGRAHGRARSGAKYRLGLALPALRSSAHRPVSTATGTTTSSSTTSLAPSTGAPSTRPASRRSPTTRRSRSRLRTGSIGRSGGARTSSSSSSTSARSAAPRQLRYAAVISPPRRRKQCAMRFRPSRPA